MIYKKLAPYIAAVYLFSAAPAYCQGKKTIDLKIVPEKLELREEFAQRLRLIAKNIEQKSELERLTELYSKKTQIKKSKRFYEEWWFRGLVAVGGGAYYYEKRKKKDKTIELTTSSDDQDDDQDKAHPLWMLMFRILF